MIRWTIAVGLAWVMIGGLAAPAQAGGKLDIREWLHRPGVKVVAVEFYATWCKPCMESVPRWRALHEKYRDDGFRLIVINTLDPGGGCANVPWNPDHRICDDDGFISNSFGVQGKLPAAFLWSWQGKLMVKKGHIDVVEQEVRKILAKNPRVAVEGFDNNGRPSEMLEMMVRSEVQMTGKFDVVLSKEERKKLKNIAKESHGMAGRPDHQCKIGAAVSANSLLSAKLVGKGRNQKLALTLNSAETGCLLTSTYVPYSEKRQAQAVREAVGALTGNLRQSPEHPSGGTFGRQAGPARRGPVVKEGHIGGDQGGEWDPTAGASEQSVVKFRSNPAGAVVLVDGKLVCKETPCSKALEKGRYNVDMQLDNYVPKKQIVEVKGNVNLVWDLKPDFATVTVTPTPSNLSVAVDGREMKGNDLRNMRLKPGPHKILIENRCYYKAGEVINVKRGETRTVPLNPKPRPSAIKVSAVDEKGNDLEARVLVDGKLQTGTTPRAYKVPVCAKKVRVEYAGKAPFEQDLHLQEKKVFLVDAKLEFGAKVNGYARVSIRGSNTVPVKVDGKLLSKYSRSRQRVRAGATLITVNNSCYEPFRKHIFVKPNSHTYVDVKPKARMGRLDIKASDTSGSALDALVFVDTKYIGKTPGVYDVPACGKSLEVHKDSRKPYTYRLRASSGKTMTVAARLSKQTSSYSNRRQNRKIAGWMRRAGKPYTWSGAGVSGGGRSYSSRRKNYFRVSLGLNTFNNEKIYDSAGEEKDSGLKYNEMPILIGAEADLANVVGIYGRMRWVSRTAELVNAGDGASSFTGSGLGDLTLGLRFSGAGWRWNVGMVYDMQAEDTTPEGELAVSDKMHALFLGVSRSFSLSSSFSASLGLDINTFLEKEGGGDATTPSVTAGTIANVWLDTGLHLFSGARVGLRLGRIGQAKTTVTDPSSGDEQETDGTDSSMIYLTPYFNYCVSKLCLRLAMEHQGVYNNWGLPLSGTNAPAGYGLMSRVSLAL